MGSLLVTLGTDGNTNWVSTPDGQRFSLGALSVLDFVARATRRSRMRQVLNTYNRRGEVIATVDEDLMWDILAPKRPVWAADSSSIAVSNAEPLRNIMPTLSDDLSAIESHVAAMNQAATRKATNMAEGVAHLVRLANKIKSPNQSKNKTYYNLGISEAPTETSGSKQAGELTFDRYEGNSNLANEILATAEEALDKITTLESMGRPFNAAKAKLDVRAVTQKVAGILQTDLTADWVRDDLTKLASRANEIHALFANAK